MELNLQNLAIIPARGGSKRIPYKNRREFHGVPAIQRVIEEVRKSEIFEWIVVSTDDEATAKIAKEAGAHVPFVRPAAIADDFTPTRDVVTHAIVELSKQGIETEDVCCIYPLSVFMTEADLNATFQLYLATEKRKFVTVVTEYGHPIYRSLRMDEKNLLVPNFPENIARRTQDLPRSFHDTGQLYWGSAANWCGEYEILDNSVGYEIPSWRVQDIDSSDDWKRAELLFEMLQKLE